MLTINDLVRRFGSALGALRNFTANANHQLRTLLTVMRTQLEIAHRAKDREELTKALGETDAAIGDAEWVLSQMLVLARIDSAAQQDLSRHSCDIAVICRELCEDLISNNDAADVDLGYEGPGSLSVRGDAVLVREMLRNLVDNAMRHGGRPIEITVRTREDATRAVVEVEDNGIGIAPALRPAVLKRFQRGAESDEEGSGLGLAIAGEIAQLFGGRLALQDPADGRGLRVSVSFERD